MLSTKQVHRFGPLVAIALLSLPSSDVRAEGRFSSFELRGRLPASTLRLSRPVEEPQFRADGLDSAFYFGLGMEMRAFAESGHGLFANVEYRCDVLLSEIISNENHSVDTSMTVGHLGYARRFVFRRHPNSRFFFAITPHIGASIGVQRMKSNSRGDIDLNTAVLGARSGVDFDFHHGRFIFGWGLSYEFLTQTNGPLDQSHYISTNFVPYTRLGISFE